LEKHFEAKYVNDLFAAIAEGQCIIDFKAAKEGIIEENTETCTDGIL